jgi:hypothetical protein
MSAKRVNHERKADGRDPEGNHRRSDSATVTVAARLRRTAGSPSLDVAPQIWGLDVAERTEVGVRIGHVRPPEAFGDGGVRG